MSFGVSISDIISLVQIGKNTYRDWRDAPEEYKDIIDHLGRLQTILGQLRREMTIPNSLLAADGENAQQLREVLQSSRRTVNQLNKVVKKYDSLAKSQKKTSDRLRLPFDKLRDLRQKLTLSIVALSSFLELVTVGAIGRVEQGIKGLPKMTQAINNLAAEFRSGRREGSIMTVYDDDDKAVWREFRKELISEGFRSEVIKRHGPKIRRYIADLDSAGKLEEEAPGSPNDELVDWTLNAPTDTLVDSSSEEVKIDLQRSIGGGLHDESATGLTATTEDASKSTSTLSRRFGERRRERSEALFTTSDGDEQISPSSEYENSSNSPELGLPAPDFMPVRVKLKQPTPQRDAASDFRQTEFTATPQDTCPEARPQGPRNTSTNWGAKVTTSEKNFDKIAKDSEEMLLEIDLPRSFNDLKLLYGQYYAESGKVPRTYSQKATCGGYFSCEWWRSRDPDGYRRSSNDLRTTSSYNQRNPRRSEELDSESGIFEARFPKYGDPHRNDPRYSRPRHRRAEYVEATQVPDTQSTPHESVYSGTDNRNCSTVGYEPLDPLSILEEFVKNHGAGSDADDEVFEISTDLKEAIKVYRGNELLREWQMQRRKQKEEQDRVDVRLAREQMLKRTDWGDGPEVEDITDMAEPNTSRPDSGQSNFRFSNPADVYAKFLKENGGIASVEVEDAEESSEHSLEE